MVSRRSPAPELSRICGGICGRPSEEPGGEDIVKDREAGRTESVELCCIKIFEAVVGVDGVDYRSRAHNRRVVVAIGVVTME